MIGYRTEQNENIFFLPIAKETSGKFLKVSPVVLARAAVPATR